MLTSLARGRSGRARDSRGLRLFGLALVAAVLAWPASGQVSRFRDCQGIRQDGRDQIVVGDVGLAPAANPDAAGLARRHLHQRLRQQLADLASSPGGAVYLVMCPGHAPSPSDYTQNIVAHRYGSGVLVELWGEASGTEAAITYALLPLLLPPAGPGTGTAGFYDLGYRIDPQGGIADIFAEAVELRAFTALSAGLRALAEAKRTQDGTRYDRAYATLCKAHGLLGEAARRDNPLKLGPTPQEWEALRGLALAQANAVRAALVGPTHSAILAKPPAGVSVGNCAVPPPDPPPPPLASLDTGTRR